MANVEQMGSVSKFIYKATEVSQVVDVFVVAVGAIFASAPTVALGIVGLVSGEVLKNKLKSA